MKSACFKFKTPHANLASFLQSHGHPAPKTAISFALHNNRKRLFFIYITTTKQCIMETKHGLPSLFLHLQLHTSTHNHLIINI